MPLVPVEDFLLWMVDQIGAAYVFGAEVAIPPPPRVEALDCSEYTQAASHAAHVTPPLPDGAYSQWKTCPAIAVPIGIATRGALLFMGDGTGVGRAAIGHVALSLGGDRTLEARGRAYRVGIFDRAAARGFDFAGLIPGVDYAHPGTPIPRPPTPATAKEDELVFLTQFLDHPGDWYAVEPSTEAGVSPNGYRYHGTIRYIADGNELDWLAQQGIRKVKDPVPGMGLYRRVA